MIQPYRIAGPSCLDAMMIAVRLIPRLNPSIHPVRHCSRQILCP
ncbi:hypothetical protein L249_6334 [Ophiocordyceps polyrhachis-furcata BCC 54312]|uniref:Uncharacterized protein n=1 Tax=Ophiocordyceps polyrhachis-furcata BCC 54312 TaxID=1330021 RepID=A0A367L155_9HYPO|nr:hypothetical protein L249_6334 [Ophiocordyceps polyrhachis-furcata BCC 54312]